MENALGFIMHTELWLIDFVYFTNHCPADRTGSELIGAPLTDTVVGTRHDNHVTWGVQAHHTFLLMLGGGGLERRERERGHVRLFKVYTQFQSVQIIGKFHVLKRFRHCKPCTKYFTYCILHQLV